MNTYILIDQKNLINRQDDWRELVNQSSTQTIFLQPEYLLPWINSFLIPKQVVLKGLTDDNSQLVAIIPLFWEDNQTLRLIGAVDLSDYLDIAVRSGKKKEIYQEIIAYLAKEVGPWTTLQFESIPAGSETLTVFCQLAEKQGWHVTKKQQTICPAVILPKTWDQYLANLEPKNLQQFRKLLKNIGAEDEITYRCIEKSEEVAEQMDSFIQLHKSSSSEKQQFWTPKREAFFKQTATALAEQNWVKLYFLDVEGQPAASLLIFDYHNQFLVYNSGFDAYRFGHLGVGNAIILHTIRHAIELKRSCYDFMRGEETYKFLFNVEAKPVFDVTISR